MMVWKISKSHTSFYRMIDIIDIVLSANEKGQMYCIESLSNSLYNQGKKKLLGLTLMTHFSLFFAQTEISGRTFTDLGNM